MKQKSRHVNIFVYNMDHVHYNDSAGTTLLWYQWDQYPRRIETSPCSFWDLVYQSSDIFFLCEFTLHKPKGKCTLENTSHQPSDYCLLTVITTTLICRLYLKSVLLVPGQLVNRKPCIGYPLCTWRTGRMGPNMPKVTLSSQFHFRPFQISIWTTMAN